MGKDSQTVRMRTSSGYKVSVTFAKKGDGWKIFSLGGVSQPTALLPYSISSLVFNGTVFTSLDDAKSAVKAA